MHRTGSNETDLVSEIASIINDENVIIAPGQEKKTVSILNDEFCEKQVKSKHFLIFSLKVNLAIKLLKMFQ